MTAYRSLKSTLSFDWQFVDTLGTLFLAEVTMTPIFKKNGTWHTLAIIRDVTYEKVAEKELQESEQKYRDLFENVYDAIVQLDNKANVVTCNKATLDLFDVETEEELKAIHVPDVVHPDDREKSVRYFKQLLEKGFYSNYQGRLVTQDGNVKYIEVSSVAIYDDEGKFAGSRDIIRDITEQKNCGSCFIAKRNTL